MLYFVSNRPTFNDISIHNELTLKVFFNFTVHRRSNNYSIVFNLSTANFILNKNINILRF